MRIIPAIDIIDGKCVRLTQGDYAQKKIYNENPLEVAKQFEDAGLKYLHLVDLDGAKAGAVTNWETVKQLTSKTKLEIDFGGGIKSREEFRKLIELGVKQVNLGSIAVKNPELVFDWIDEFGSEKIILSADVKNEQVHIHGWQENASLHIIEFVKKYRSKGVDYVTCTDINTDGMLNGPNVELYKNLLNHFPEIKLIASGGVGSIDDVIELKSTGVNGVIIGKAIYENRISLEQLMQIENGAE